ncbi:MAG: hypothetical protein ACREAM_21745 [Blastocatellia bacterium]
MFADHLAPVYSDGMQMIVNVSPEAEKMLGELAARNGRPAPEVAGELLEEKLKETASLALTDEDGDFDPDALERAIAQMMSRTPEEIEETRARLFQEMEPPRPLPPGKSLFDVVCGQWPGDETDEEVRAALARLS